MTTTPKDSQEKARADNTGAELLKDYEPATTQQLVNDPFLLKLEQILPPDSLLYVTHDITIMHGDEIGKTVPTTGKIGIVLRSRQGDIVGAVFYTPNSKEKPIIIDPTGYGAIVFGDYDSSNEVMASDNANDAADTYLGMLDPNITIIASTQKINSCFKQTVKHWGSASPVTVTMTLDEKGRQRLFAGLNAKAVITTAHIVTLLQSGLDYTAILNLDDTQLINLKDTAYYPEWRDDPQLNEPMIYADGRFELYHDGLFFVKYNDDDPANITFKFKAFICSPIEVIAKTRDTSSGTWGRLLQWRDDDNVLHTWSMPLSLLQGDAREYRKELASQGLNITTNSKQRSYLDTYIQNYPIHKRALCVDRLGWHGEQYILPDGAVGGDDDKELIVYQSANAINSTLAQQGTLSQWRDELCKPLAKQSRFVFSIACAFAGQLLELLGSDGGGFHIIGSSTMGKSLSLKVASSVWGKPESYTKTWRSTDNALEGTASEYNDSFLPLDEISECDPKIVGKVVYMLGNGTGKGRSTTTGHNRIAKTWRIIFLSTGEKTIKQQMIEAGQKTNAGIEVRMAHIDADAGAGNDLRMFDSLVLADTGAAQADKINELSQAYYGSAGVAWLEHITTDKAATTATAKQLVDDFMSKYSDLAPQAHRVARRFAIVAAAGEMATSAGITGWQAGQATTAVMTCLDNWLDNYGRDGEHEQRQIIEHIKAFIEQHGSSRFQPCHKNIHQDFEVKINNRVGYHNYNTEEYYFTTSTFDEVCAPFSKSKVLQVLNDANLLNVTESDRHTSKVPLPFEKNRKRVYAVKNDILSYETNKSTGTAGTTGTTHTQQGLGTVPSNNTPMGQLGQSSSIC